MQKPTSFNEASTPIPPAAHVAFAASPIAWLALLPVERYLSATARLALAVPLLAKLRLVNHQQAG
jgi:hypothetical protein